MQILKHEFIFKTLFIFLEIIKIFTKSKRFLRILRKNVEIFFVILIVFSKLVALYNMRVGNMIDKEIMLIINFLSISFINL